MGLACSVGVFRHMAAVKRENSPLPDVGGPVQPQPWGFGARLSPVAWREHGAWVQCLRPGLGHGRRTDVWAKNGLSESHQQDTRLRLSLSVAVP